jgi:hypothetical protein
MNAMALIAPGAFLWLTFFIQSAYGAPLAAQGMWFGIFAALLLCLATAIAYAELSKLYPGAGSSYFFAEQAFLSKTKAYKFARMAKFMVGWASHLYYWAYPGLMVGVTALVVGYMLGAIWPGCSASRRCASKCNGRRSTPSSRAILSTPDGGSRSFMAKCTGAAAGSGHIGPAVRNTGSMFTRVGTNGVDKSFSSGSRGDRRHGHVGDAVSANASARDSGRHSEELRLDAR